MNQEYVDTVRLLLAIGPAVFQSPRLALKGGTALNLLLHDMPRLSVDIDEESRIREYSTWRFLFHAQ
jgi:predicted nucleotidyltransferase component of viral defense system